MPANNPESTQEHTPIYVAKSRGNIKKALASRNEKNIMCVKLRHSPFIAHGLRERESIPHSMSQIILYMPATNVHRIVVRNSRV